VTYFLSEGQNEVISICDVNVLFVVYFQQFELSANVGKDLEGIHDEA
jgi:hypothetical protein